MRRENMNKNVSEANEYRSHGEMRAPLNQVFTYDVPQRTENQLQSEKEEDKVKKKKVRKDIKRKRDDGTFALHQVQEPKQQQKLRVPMRLEKI
jgi:hypothetical protein